MKILVNAVNLKVAGGLAVAFNFLEAVGRNSRLSGHQYHVLAPSGVGYERFANHSITVEIVPAAMESPLRRLYLDWTWLRPRIEALKPDVVFTMGNIAVPTDRPQAVLFMYPYAIYPEERAAWDRLGLARQIDYRFRNWVFRRRLRHADLMFPQTRTAARRLSQYYAKEVPPCTVVPAAYTEIGEDGSAVPPFEREVGVVHLLCLTKYYAHKNLEVLPDFVLRLDPSPVPVRVITTIEADQGAGARRFLDRIRQPDVAGRIVNIGKVPIRSVPALYDRVDGLIMPTLLESFSSTYADAMHFRKPVFTSDRDFARDVCGDVAFYFEPLDPGAIARVVSDAFSQPAELRRRIDAGSERVQGFPRWGEVSHRYVCAMEALCQGERVVRRT